MFFSTGQEENANDINKYHKKDNYADAVFEPIVNFPAYLNVLRKQDPMVTFIFPRNRIMKEIVFSARTQAGRHFPVGSDGSLLSGEIMLRLLGVLVAFYAYLTGGK